MLSREQFQNHLQQMRTESDDIGTAPTDTPVAANSLG